MTEEKKVKDLVEPVVTCSGHETLGRIVQTLNQRKPVAVDWKGWWLLLPEATAGYALSRRVIDLPLTDAPVIQADLSAAAALGLLIGQGSARPIAGPYTQRM